VTTVCLRMRRVTDSAAAGAPPRLRNLLALLSTILRPHMRRMMSRRTALRGLSCLRQSTARNGEFFFCISADLFVTFRGANRVFPT
jgi:hypothetical protein